MNLITNKEKKRKKLFNIQISLFILCIFLLIYIIGFILYVKTNSETLAIRSHQLSSEENDRSNFLTSFWLFFASFLSTCSWLFSFLISVYAIRRKIYLDPNSGFGAFALFLFFILFLLITLFFYIFTREVYHPGSFYFNLQ